MRTVITASSMASSPTHSYTSSPIRSSSPTHNRHTFSESIMEENVEIAHSIITKWDVDAPTYSKVANLFSDDRREAKEFLRSVKELQDAMQFFISENLSTDKLVRAQSLMQIAMKRLEKEFFQILSSNRNFLDPESISSRSSRASRSINSASEDEYSEDELQIEGISITNSNSNSNSISEVERVSLLVMSDLKAIADCMTSSGYSKECVKIYKLIRKSIVDESLYVLGTERFTSSQIQKMDWDVIELKIKNWLNAVKVAVKTIFNGERLLCDYVFSSSEMIRDSCFTDICKDAAIALFQFPEFAAKSHRSPEKMFRTLDLYEAISDLFPEIESIFSYESTSAVRSHAVTSLIKLGENVRTMLSDFEAAIQKDSTKSPVPGGGIHPLTRYVMNYVVFLADYSGVLSDIVADWPLAGQSPLPESYFPSPTTDEAATSVISIRLAWLILVLLCKLDGKAQLYKDVSLSYLFLTNNLNYVVSKAGSSNLKLLLGDDWLMKTDIKVRQYAANYERMGWNKVITSLPDQNQTAEISPEEVKECFKRFSMAFEEAYRKQSSWVVPDQKLRDEIKVSLAKNLIPPYRAFYDRYRMTCPREVGVVDSMVKFAPDDLGNYLSDLFYGSGGSVSGSTSSSHPSPSRDRRSI